MATDPEAQTQLARLLGDESLRSASRDQLAAAADARFDLLVDGIVAEAAASDDVLDRDSALTFVQLRLRSFAGVLSQEQASRLLGAVQEKIASW